MRLPDRVAILVNRPEESNTALGEEAVHDVMDAAEAAEEALQEVGCKTVVIGTGSSPAAFIRELEDANPQLVVNFAEEAWGSDRFEPAIAYLLTARGIPFTGNPPETLVACRDKIRARLLASAAGAVVGRGVGFRTPPTGTVTLPYAVVVKPACHDGSIGITSDSVVQAGHDIVPAIQACASHGGYPVLAEEYIDGRELNVTLYERLAGGWTIVVSELDYSDMPEGKPRILSYQGKWIQGSENDLHTIVHPGVDLDPDLDSQVKRTADALIEAFGIRGYARFDTRVDRQGRVTVIDVNPNPDIAPAAGVVRALASRDIEHADFIREQVALAWRRGTGES
jgi:D-alanine-D-alanine ligase